MTFSADILIQYTSHPWRVSNEVFAKEDAFWSNVDDMAAGVKTAFSAVFRGVSVGKTGKLSVVPESKIVSLEFLNGLNIVLGFLKRYYTIDSNMLVAENVPFLRHGINTMYVYSSICQPVCVGGVCVPLLKSIWLDSSESFKHLW